jgi:sulfur carrier protein
VIEIVVNGENQSVRSEISVAEFLTQLGLGSPAVAVEINAELAPRDAHHHTILQQGDVLEIVTLVGGG